MAQIYYYQNMKQLYKIALMVIAFLFVGCTKAPQTEVLDTSRSSFITGAEYSPDGTDSGTLVVQIRDNEYVYGAVSAAEWKAFQSAESLGSHYNKHIKDVYGE